MILFLFCHLGALSTIEIRELDAEFGKHPNRRAGYFTRVWQYIDEECNLKRSDADVGKVTHTLKITILGNSGVGKTSFLRRWVSRTFSASYKSTIGADFFCVSLIPATANCYPREVRHVITQMWDTAGQERFQCLGRAYYRGTDGVFLVFAINNRGSFEEIEKTWVPELKANLEGEPPARTVLIGMKCDLPESSRQVTRQEARALAYRLGCKYIECSAKEDINVDRAMLHLATRALRRSLQVNGTKIIEASIEEQQGEEPESVFRRVWNWASSWW